VSPEKLLELWNQHERRLAPTLAFLLAALVLFPKLGTFGLWDPQEIQIADQARELAKTGDVEKIYKTRPPLTLYLIAQGMKIGGVGELSARLPLALLGLIAVMATYALGARLKRPRAGYYAAIVLACSPLFLFESRQLTSDVATLACQAVAMLGLVGLVWPERGRYHPVWTTIDVLLAWIGLRGGFLAAGLLVGVLIPLAGVSLAALVALVGRLREPGPAPAVPLHVLAVGTAIVGVATLVVLYVSVDKIYDWLPAQPKQLQLLGKTLAPAKGYIPAIGGLWRAGPAPATSSFDVMVNQIAFGMFPWSALAPIAVLRLATPRERDREAWGGLVALFWALAAYVVCTIWVRKVGDIRYPALPAIALATGLFLDDVIRAKVEGDPSRAPTARAGMPLAALFVLLAAVQLGRDCLNFPEELAAVHLLTTIKYPVELKVMGVVLAFGLLFALFGAIGLWMPSDPGPPAPETKGGPPYREAIRKVARRLQGLRRPLRYSLHEMLGVGILFAIFCSWIFTPRLSEHFSYKNVFQSYFDHRKGGEPLGVMGIPGNGPEYYAKGEFERLDREGRGRQNLLAFLKRVERVFAVVPASELCPVHQASGAEHFQYHVLDNRNSRFLLLSNQLDGAEDQNPLLTAIRREPPPSMKKAYQVSFDGKIELIGADLPDVVSHGDMFEITLYFRVVQKPTQNYKILAHFDGKGVRFQGDHDPIGGRCGTTFWQTGDYIVDRFSVKAGEITHPTGPYSVWVGFFTGGAGQWKNMPITSGNGGADNRFNLGTIRVR
jgi:4-amino-4-deoxy-L-arabinose transferase-like glycosyltransferase